MPVLAHLLQHELRSLIRTRRVLVLLGLYLTVGGLAGFGYVKAVQVARDAALERAEQEGVSEDRALALIDEAASPLATQILEGAAGAEEGQAIAESLATSTILPVFFWASLAFLPFLILLSSFDTVSSELATKSLRYSVLRASRAEILFGKTSAHLLIFAAVSAVGALALIAMAAALIEGFSVTDNLPGFLRVWLLLLPFAACYVALATFASCTTQRGFFALLLSLIIAMGLRITGWTASAIDEAGDAAPLRALRFVSPGHYHGGLWLADWSGPAISSAAYLGFAAVFLALAHAVLQRRDL